MPTGQVNIKNRRAGFEYHLQDAFTAGIQLTGSEIKSIRAGKASIAEAFCLFIGHELWLRDMHVAEYAQASYENHEPKRDRKLLLKKKELEKIKNTLKDKGLTVIPTRLFIGNRGFAKLDIAIAKGKKLYDKRESLKRKDSKREIDRALKK